VAIQLSVVCGLHRSGTTFVGDILRYGGAVVVHEPLNERFGMADVSIAYPHADSKGDVFAKLLDDAVNLARPWNKNTTYIRANGLRRQMYALTGGRSGLRWGWLRLRHKLGVAPPHLCLKDPFMTLATSYLVRQHGLKVVCVVRHPAAIHYSTEKQSWRFDVDNLLRQPELMSRFGADIPDKHWDLARTHTAASIALLWKLMARTVYQSLQENDKLLVVRHEDLCTAPLTWVQKIYAHFKIPYTDSIQKYVKMTSSGSQVEAPDGQIHSFNRNALALVNAWRGKLGQKDSGIIREIIGEDYSLFYDRW